MLNEPQIDLLVRDLPTEDEAPNSVPFRVLNRALALRIHSQRRKRNSSRERTCPFPS